MPQLEVADFMPQLVWLAITFVTLYLILWRSALPKIGMVLEERQDRIAGDLDQAQALKRQADDALSAYEADVAKARERAHGMAADSREKAKADLDRRQAEIDASLAEKSKAAESAIAATREEAMAGIREVAGEAAGAVVARLIGSTPDSTVVAAAINRAAEDLEGGTPGDSNTGAN